MKFMLMTKKIFHQIFIKQKLRQQQCTQRHLLRLKLKCGYTASAVYHDLNEVMKYILILHKTEYSYLFCLMTKLTITTTTTKTYLFNWCHYSQSGM